MQFVLLTGLRRRESCALQWSHIDLRGRAICLPGSLTKNGQPHAIPLSNYLLSLLCDRQRDSDSVFVFPGAGASGHLEEPKTALAKVNREAGAACSCHGLRRTYSVVAQNVARVPDSVRKQLLNHSPGRDVTSEHYSEPLPVEELAQYQQRITDAILRLAGRRKAATNVVALEVAK